MYIFEVIRRKRQYRKYMMSKVLKLARQGHMASKFQEVNSISSHSKQLILLPSYASRMCEKLPDIGYL